MIYCTSLVPSPPPRLSSFAVRITRTASDNSYARGLGTRLILHSTSACGILVPFSSQFTWHLTNYKSDPVLDINNTCYTFSPKLFRNFHIPPFAFPFFLTEDSICMVSGFSPSAGVHGTTGNKGVVTLHPVALLAFFPALHSLTACSLCEQ